ncbi:MAG: T9SS type A sorting domain-containing protein [Bacteroidota bacterium]
MALRYVLPLLIAPLAAAQSFEWQSTAGPTAAITAVQIYADGSVLGLSGGRLYRSGDDGLSWNEVAAAPDTLRNLRVEGARIWALRDGRIETAAWLEAEWEVRSPATSVSQFVTHGDSLYAMARGVNYAFYRSFDRGLSWERVQLPTYAPPYAPLVPNTFRILSDGTLFGYSTAWPYVSPHMRSGDAGTTWTETTCRGERVVTDGTRTYFAEAPFINKVGGRGGGLLYRSTDGGVTCEQLSVGSSVFSVKVARDGRLLVGSASGLLISSDAGDSLEKVAMKGLVVSSISESPAGTLLMSTGRNPVYCFDPPCPVTTLPAGSYRWTGDEHPPTLSGPRTFVPTVSVFNGELMAGGHAIYRLVDRFESEAAQTQGWAYTGVNGAAGDMYVDRDQLIAVWQSGQGFGYRVLAADGSVRFDLERSGPYDFDYVEGLSSIIRTQEGRFLATSQRILYGPGGLYQYASESSDPYWDVVLGDVLGLDALYQNPGDGTIYAGCNGGLRGEVYLENCPGVVVSDDEGQSWESRSNGLPAMDGRTEVFAFTTDVTGTVLAATRDGVYALNGSAWEPRGLVGVWLHDLETVPGVGTLAATEAGDYRIERGVMRWAGGEIWQAVGTGLAGRTVYDILGTDNLLDGETVLVAATDRGVFTSTPLVSIDAEDEAVPTEAFAVVAYPNPFAEALTVEVALPEATEVRTTVYDVLGRVVAEMPARLLDAGAHRLPMETNGLAPGVYLVRVSATGHPERVVTLTRVR